MERTTIIAARLQPLGLQAESTIRKVLSRGGRAVVLIRDADRPRSVSDPFSYVERVDMLKTAFPDSIAEGRLSAVPLGSFGYDEGLRLSRLRQAVESAGGEDVALRGFSPAELMAVPARRSTVMHIAATTPHQDAASSFDRLMRAVNSGEAAGKLVPGAVASWLSGYSATDEYRHLEDELREIFSVRKRYGAGPHNTADAICTYKDKILLVTRGNPPFRGMLAIPGGILDAGENALDAAVRELAEEAFADSGKSMPASVVMGALRSREPRVYDGIGRDPRGEYVAHAFHFDFSSLPEQPTVTPGDDARLAEWHPRSSLSPEGLAFDHYPMLHDVVGLPYRSAEPAEEPECRP